MSETQPTPRHFRPALNALRHVQKSSGGGPPYSLFINRPLGRIIAAAAYQVGLTPNQVTYLSALLTAAGLAVLALGPASWLTGIFVTMGLVLGYAFDSADGQLARLRGGGTFAGEWLDHMIDSVKVAAVHVAVLISLYRNFGLHPVWLLVPLGFTVVSTVHFFGMILVDLMTRVQRAKSDLAMPVREPASLPKTLVKLPTDYGVLCLLFLLLGAHQVFFGIYVVLAAATAGYTVLVVGKWRHDVLALDAQRRTGNSVPAL
jgi:phosphatidylglycerophosphate synthase